MSTKSDDCILKKIKSTVQGFAYKEIWKEGIGQNEDIMLQKVEYGDEPVF